MIHQSTLSGTHNGRTPGPTSIHVVGAGGNGGHFISGLARLHAALPALGKEGFKVTLFDPDIVTEANLGRQLFSPADLGQPKANVLIHRLNLFHGLDWKAVPALYSVENGFSCADLVVGCVDTKQSRRSIWKIAQRGSRYWLDLGNNAQDGQVILGEPVGSSSSGFIRSRKLYNPNRLPTVMELCPAMNKRNAKEDDTPSCSLAEALEKQDLFINQTLATLALHLLWSLFRNEKIDHHGYFVNLAGGRVTPLPVCPDTWNRMGVRRAEKKQETQKKGTLVQLLTKRTPNR